MDLPVPIPVLLIHTAIKDLRLGLDLDLAVAGLDTSLSRGFQVGRDSSPSTVLPRPLPSSVISRLHGPPLPIVVQPHVQKVPIFYNLRSP